MAILIHNNSTSRENTKKEEFVAKILEFEGSTSVFTKAPILEHPTDKQMSIEPSPVISESTQSLADIFVTPMVGNTDDPENTLSAEEKEEEKEFYSSKVIETLETTVNITLSEEELTISDEKDEEDYQEEPTISLEKTKLQEYMDTHPTIAYLLDIKKLVDTLFVPPFYT